jgi:hypothetical protein
MKHVTFADKSLLIGNDAADTLLEYAAVLADRAKADNVTVNAISSDGDDVVATILLDTGAPLMAETSTTQVAEPDNSAVVEYMRARISALANPPVVPDSPMNYTDFDDLRTG